MSSEGMERHDGRLDVARGVAELAERLPPTLEPLARAAYNYRWSWVMGAAALFEEIDPVLWRRSQCNPRYVLEGATPRRLSDLGARPAFIDRVRALGDTIATDLGRPPAATAITNGPVAYFCSEFAVHCSLPLYGGGLGVLAGDVLKAASDLALPMVGVGLLYQGGYFCQRLDQSGWQVEYWVDTDFDRLPIVRVTGSDGIPLSVALTIRGRRVQIQVWRVDVGRVPLFLLDTDRDDNHPIDRWITHQLYVGDRHTRLAQYAVLGIGGMRMLDALGIRPSLAHLNEGHAVLGTLERLRLLVHAGRSYEEALDEVRRQTVFTTHTPVAAGNEGYHENEMEEVLREFIDGVGLPRATFYDLGRVTPGDRDEACTITPIALRTSRAANGVSRRHAEVSREMWRQLWPDRSPGEVPIGHVTNGVHTRTWMAEPMQSLLDAHLGPGWRTRMGDATLWSRVASIPDPELWRVRCAQRQALVRYVRLRATRDRLTRGELPSWVEAAASVFDPKVLTIGFARRVATYKRLYLLTRVTDRGVGLLQDEARPIQIFLAGKAHPRDTEAKHTLQHVFQMKRMPAVAGRVAYLENYDLHMAPRIMAGVDLWLNLPRPPLEASGTSGMKVVLNGALNLSVLDGWWAEAWDGENGWAIETPEGDPAAQDDHDAQALLDLLEREVIPLFYDRDTEGVPRGWLARVKASMATLIPRFSAERMVREYVETLYAPGG